MLRPWGVMQQVRTLERGGPRGPRVLQPALPPSGVPWTAQAAAPSETQSSWPASAAASRMGTALCTATSQPCFRAALSPAAAVRHDS